MNDKKNVYEILKESRLEILNEIIDLIDKNPKDWVKGWNSSMVAPFNSKSNNYYNGGNILKAALKSKELESKDPRWLTFKQIKDEGLKLKKGATSVKMEYWSYPEQLLDDEKISKLNDKELKRIENKINFRIDKGYTFYDENGIKISNYINRNDSIFNKIAIMVENTPTLSYFNVFNGKDIEGLSEFKYPEIKDSELWDIADDLIASSPVPVKEVAQEGAFTEFKNKKSNEIVLPPRETFENSNEFLATLLHEMGHETSSDLDRRSNAKFGDLKYAKEELVAEFTSIICQGRLGIELNQTAKENHSAYIKSWTEVIKDKEYDKEYKPEKELFTALSEATKASELIMDRYKDKRKELGKDYVDIIEINSKDIENSNQKTKLDEKPKTKNKWSNKDKSNEKER